MNALNTIEPETFDLPATGSLSLALPETLSFGAWQHVGRELAAQEKVLNWWIGDWWVFGEHRYGERAKAAASELFPHSLQRLMNIGSVVRAFPETSRQQEVLSFTHHEEIAPIARENPAAASALLDLAARDGLSVAELREAAKVFRKPVERSEPKPRDDDSLLAGFLHHWNRLPKSVRLSAAELIAEADGEEIEPA